MMHTAAAAELPRRIRGEVIVRDNIFRTTPAWYREDKEKLRRATNPEAYAEGDERIRTAAADRDIEKLFLITEALWNILKKKHGYEDEDLLQMVQDIDLGDGLLDGKVAKRRSQPCPGCGRTLSSRHMICLYCGAVSDRELFDR